MLHLQGRHRIHDSNLPVLLQFSSSHFGENGSYQISERADDIDAFEGLSPVLLTNVRSGLHLITRAGGSFLP
jgi:hypothetical protein